MGKATQPVSINGLEFDALIDESRTLEATVPEYSVESGFSVSDSVILNPEKLSMTLFVTNTPVTWYRRHGASPTRVDNVVKQLEELYFAKEPVTIVTSDATYTSMAIESITISKSLEIGYARQIPISAGTASTSTGSSGGGSGSGSGSGGGSSGAGGSSGSNGNSKSSILYNAASSIGLI